MERRPDIHLQPILLVLAMAFAPFSLRLHPLVTLFCFGFWTYAFAASRHPILAWPSKPALTILVILGLALVFVSYKGELGLLLGVAVLSVLFALKPGEISSHRDRVGTVFLSFFLILFGLFASQSMAMFAYELATLLTALAVLIHLNNPSQPLRTTLASLGVLVAQGLPLALVLFLFFPRFSAGLFGMRASGPALAPRPALQAGDMAEYVRAAVAAQSGNPVVFRVTFHGPEPEFRDLYWRGSVLWFFNGPSETWFRTAAVPKGVPPAPREYSPTYVYDLLLSPSTVDWLYSLDAPLSVPKGATLAADRILTLERPLAHKKGFRLSSSPATPPDGKSDWNRYALDLPRTGNPRTRRLAEQLRDKAASPREIVESGLAYLEQNNFEYNLNPPTFASDGIDHFLFESRQGFCAHYASAFVFLMRAAGVPARVVVGFHGGTRAPGKDYYLVTGRDGHAWAEVWLDGQGWVRVDPTGTAAPVRIERGFDASVLTGELVIVDPKLQGLIRKKQEQIQAGEEDSFLESMEFLWQRTMLDYSRDSQHLLLDRLGLSLDTWKQTLLILVAGGAMLAGLIWAYIAWFRRDPLALRDPAQAAYLEFCRKMARAGAERAPGEGPLDFSRAATAVRPDLVQDISMITDLYISVRYAGHGGEDSLRLLQKHVRRFSPSGKA